MNDLASIQKLIEQKRLKIQAMKKHPFKNREELRSERREVQALGEGFRDILTSAFLSGGTGGDNEIDKNNYKTYEQKVKGAYAMYNAETNYGGEIFAGIVDIRKAFICGEGISFSTKNKAKEDFLNTFIKDNHLNGSGLMNAALMGEIEGQILFALATKGVEDKKRVIARLFSWYLNRYKVERDALDYQEIKKITYGSEKDEKTINPTESVYINLYSSLYSSQEPHPKCGKVLTQCENASRGLYDLRNNTHLFGRAIPTWETQTAADAKQINADLKAINYNLGRGYAGTAKASLLEPSGSSSDAIVKDILTNLKFSSAMTGVPMHWIAWPELMSNRATAENLLEVISAATKHERLMMIEGFTDLFEKAQEIAVESGIAKANILEGELDIKLPLISLAALQQLIEVYQPLFDAELISRFDMQNMIPGIDPGKTNKQIEKERKEKQERDKNNQTFDNSAVDDIINQVQNKPGNNPEDQGV